MKTCMQCRHLRHKPLGGTTSRDIPAWPISGEFVCAQFGLLGPDHNYPRPRTKHCKETEHRPHP